MKKKLERFIMKNNLDSKSIMYITRENKKTCIYMAGGQVVETYFSMKNILSEMETDRIIIINKGIAVSLDHVVSIDNGQYIMSNGKILKGRVRTPGEHKRNKKLVKESLADLPKDQEETEVITSEIVLKKFSVLDELPLPFGVVELKWNGDIIEDFTFAYLNRNMAILGQTTVEAALGKSFYDVFKNGDKKWIEIGYEMKKTKESISVRRFSSEVGRYLSVHCFSPFAGYVAFAVI